jgi:hypothetical protein
MEIGNGGEEESCGTECLAWGHEVARRDMGSKSSASRTFRPKAAVTRRQLGDEAGSDN